MTTSAAIGKGSKFFVADTGISPLALVALGEVTNIQPGNDDVDLIDATHMDSPGRYREYISGLIDGGEATVEGNFVPGGATDDLLTAWKEQGNTRDCRIQFPNNVVWDFDGVITGYEVSVPIDDKMTYTLTVKASGSKNVGVQT